MTYLCIFMQHESKCQIFFFFFWSKKRVLPKVAVWQERLRVILFSCNNAYNIYLITLHNYPLTLCWKRFHWPTATFSDICTRQPCSPITHFRHTSTAPYVRPSTPWPRIAKSSSGDSLRHTEQTLQLLHAKKVGRHTAWEGACRQSKMLCYRDCWRVHSYKKSTL